MKTAKKILKGTGKVILALMGGILMPVLIWVAFGVAMSQKLRSAQRKTVPTIGQILETASLSAGDEANGGRR
ncbi:MAG: hypothetical protein ABIH70_00605 [Chloroflexota bacterium]